MEVIHLQIQKRIRDTFAIHSNTAGNRLSTNRLDIFITNYYRAFHYVTKIRIKLHACFIFLTSRYLFRYRSVNITCNGRITET